MEKTLQDLTKQLLALSKSAADEKVLPQEMLIIQQKAFEVQEQMMDILSQKEEASSDVREIQNIYQIREDVWDIMASLAVREAEVKAKFGLKGEAPKAEHTCCCGHHHKDDACCHGHDEEAPKKKGCCKKTPAKKCCGTKTCATKEKKICRKK